MIIFLTGKSRSLCQFGFIWLALWLLLSAGLKLDAATTTFSFTLDEPCKTSAGVYLSNGTLVRTLWSKVHYYAAGTYSSNWDGLNDSGLPVATNVTYQIRVLQHNTEYAWDGAIGNTSAQPSGPTVHSAFYTMHDMAIAGTNAFYAAGYDEGKYDFTMFSTANPQTVLSKWCANAGNSDPNDRTWNCVCSDGNWVYFAASTSMNPTNSLVSNYNGFVIASQIGSNSQPTFTYGVAITNASYYYPNGIYVGSQPGLSGLAVQVTGNLLAVSVAPDNRVYLLDKRSGLTVGSFPVVAPGRLNFAPDGSLWVISGQSVVQFVNVSSNPQQALAIPGFSEPLAIAVCPTNANLILVADGGASQQVKAFTNGVSFWTYGLAGGYQANGPAVATNKFWFLYDLESVDGTFLSFAPDGSFWVGDGGNHRALHFSSSLAYLEQIMMQPHSYQTCVAQNNVSRVFNQFLEFNVDYTKPLAQGWTLVNNWKALVDTNHLNWEEGLFEVTTFANGRTYGLVNNNTACRSELVELTTNGIRFTGLFPMASKGHWVSLGTDGSARALSPGTAAWYESTLAGFDANNNPLWNPPALLASAPNGSGDPVPRGGSFGNVRTTISTNNILISFDQSLNNGFHLGGIVLGATNWLWEASPAANLNGCGTYEISNGVIYAGNTLQVADRNIIYGYHGEFFRNQGEAAQHMHFYDDGLFVGQFGECSVGHGSWEGDLAAFAGNAHCPSLIKTFTGDYYVWDNDESAHGSQRWHLVNAGNIREMSGSGAYGGTITLTNPQAAFPTGIVGQPGNQSVTLSWRPVTKAVSYKVYYSLFNGGPFQTLLDETPATNCILTGLTNGVAYYFAITAVINGVEGKPSEQVAVMPFNQGQNVFDAGMLAESGQWTTTVDLNSNAPATGCPAYIGDEHDTGVFGVDDLCNYGYGSLTTQTIGTKGFVLFNWGGNGSNVNNVLSPFTVTVGSGWQNACYLGREFRLGTALGTNFGFTASPVGTINIGVTDTNFHFLTVTSPAKFTDGRNFTITLTSTNLTTASYIVNENPGLSHTFQFIFRGNATLSANATGGANGIVQALFFDNVSPGGLVIPAPPTGLHNENASLP